MTPDRGEARDPRDIDAIFSEMIAGLELRPERAADRGVEPGPRASEPAAAPPAERPKRGSEPPEPGAELFRYDPPEPAEDEPAPADEGPYRPERVTPLATLSSLTLLAVGLMVGAVAVIAATGAGAPVPYWLRYLSPAAFLTGAGILIVRALRQGPPEDDGARL